MFDFRHFTIFRKIARIRIKKKKFKTVKLVTRILEVFKFFVIQTLISQLIRVKQKIQKIFREFFVFSFSKLNFSVKDDNKFLNIFIVDVAVFYKLINSKS